MLSKGQVEDILRALRVLPADKAAEVHDFVLFLKARYGQHDVDVNTAWTDEDIQDFMGSAWDYAERAS